MNVDMKALHESLDYPGLLHSEDEWFEKPWDELSNKQKVAILIDCMDNSRIATTGGYETDFCIENGKVYHADLDPGKDNKRVILTVETVEEFIKQNDFWIEDYIKEEAA